MSKPIEKTKPQPLVHLPSDVLDSFGRYDARNRNWVKFDASVTKQIEDLEEKNRQYIRVRAAFDRHSFR